MYFAIKSKLNIKMNPMNARSIGLSASLLMALVFQWFFWAEKPGLNLLLFSSLVLGLLLYLHPESHRNSRVWVTVVGTLFTGVMVIWHNSGTAKVIHVGATLLAAGYIQRPQLRSAAYAMGQTIGGYVNLLHTWYLSVQEISQGRAWLRQGLGYAKLVVIPLVAVIIFAMLLGAANPKLAEMGSNAVGWLGTWLENWSWGRLGYYGLGLGLVSALLLPRAMGAWVGREKDLQDQLRRVRKSHKKSFPLTGLRREFRTGVLLLIMVNLLLLANNLVDFNWIWWDFQPEAGFDLTQFVHEGTYYLIISILLAMGIMLYFFRGNLNYFRNNRLLRTLAYVWISQNAFLTLSVALRNYHYIAESGLAYKRIGVFFFLSLVLFGLFSLLMKIRDRMSIYYLMRVNGWAVYAAALALCVVNWDVQITRYNLAHAEKTDSISSLDREFLLEMTAAALPELLSHQEVFSQTQDPRTASYYQQWLHRDLTRFEEHQANYSWLSWNASDARVKRFLEENPQLINSLSDAIE